MTLRLLAFAGIILLLLPFFASAATCPNLYRNLSFGSRGQDVVSLQNFLIAEGDLGAGNNTGYFGKFTEAAVKKWQASHGVVSSGTPKTTGYGAVGPKTRAAIKASCGAAPATVPPTSTSTIPITFNPPPPSTSQQPPELAQCPIVPLPIGQACSGTWKEVKATQGVCTASWQCVTN